MNVSDTLAAWRTRRRAIDECSIGFAPTMGALHRGHSSLVERCRGENQVVVVSIFVNPSQFNDPSDLERYPRPIHQDLALLQSLGVDEVIVPSVRELYPNGYRFRVEPHGSDLVLEGAHRPGFLQGVMTVVLKLLNLVRADHAYSGEKDYQQLNINQREDAGVLPSYPDQPIDTGLIPCSCASSSATIYSGCGICSRHSRWPPQNTVPAQ